MTKGIIIYQSRYGAAKKYAGWLREETGFPCVEVSKTDRSEVAEYETLVFCGGIYASGIEGISFLKRNISRLKDKKVVILCVGASPYDKKAFEEVKARNLTGKLKEIPIFYARGAWNERKMKFTDRTLCRILQKSISKKDPDTYEPWMKALMCAAGQNCDWTDRNYLTPVLNYLQMF